MFSTDPDKRHVDSTYMFVINIRPLFLLITFVILSEEVKVKV